MVKAIQEQEWVGDNKVVLGAVMDNNGYVGADVDDDGGASVDAFRAHSVSNVDDSSPGPNEIAKNDCSALDEEHRYLNKRRNGNKDQRRVS